MAADSYSDPNFWDAAHPTLCRPGVARWPDTPPGEAEAQAAAAFFQSSPHSVTPKML